MAGALKLFLSPLAKTSTQSMAAFTQLTGADAATAKSLLEEAGGDLEAATQKFFDSADPPAAMDEEDGEAALVQAAQEAAARASPVMLRPSTVVLSQRLYRPRRTGSARPRRRSHQKHPTSSSRCLPASVARWRPAAAVTASASRAAALAPA